MPRAESPDEMEVAIRFAAYPNGERRVEHATEFLILYKDQFGTPLICGQNPGELMRMLHPAVEVEAFVSGD